MKVGPQSPHRGTPARRRPSLRRTTTHTCLRPDGLLGDLRVVAHGRDLVTREDGVATTAAEGHIDAEVDFVNGGLVKALRVEPEIPSTANLAGLRVSSGFRKAVAESVSRGDGGGSLTYQLLDDLSTAVLVSGVAYASAGIHPARGFSVMASRADICAGWATGGTLMVEAERLDHPPVVIGPDALTLDSPDDDPLAWHPVAAMGPHSTQRRRRIDVWRRSPESETEDVIAVEAFFRDTQADDQGAETVVHEYVVTAELEPGSLRFLSCDADVGVLPWTECPSAAASSSRVVGRTPHDLRDFIRETFVGTSTCTHLNDTLRALAALPYLASALGRGEIRT